MGAACLFHHHGQNVQIIIEQNHIRTVSRHIGTCSHCGRHISLGKDGGVVDPVADHHDFTSLFLQIFHISQLVFRRGFGTIGIQTQLLRNLGYGSLSVAA